MNNYCSQCGSKNGQQANFCPKCGQDLRTLKKTEQTVVSIKAEEESAPIDVNSLKDKIKISVDMQIAPPITVGEYISSAGKSTAGEKKIRRKAEKVPSGKALLKKIMSECSSSRGRSSEESPEKINGEDE